MKVALVLKRLEVGGIENLVLRISEHLSNDHEVCIICTEGNGEWDPIAENLGLRLKKFYIWDFKDPVTFIETIAEFIIDESFAAIYINDTIIGSAVAGLVDSKTKKITVLHAIDTISISVAVSNRENMDGFIAISPRIKRILDNDETENSVLVPNGISNDFFGKMSDRVEQDSELKLLYCGRLSHSDKGVLFLPKLLELFSSHSDEKFSLTIVGDGPARSELERMIYEKKLNDFVTIKGSLKKDNIIQEMKEAHFLIFPSLSEGFGLSIIEAQAMGCIPVAFLIDGVTDYLIKDNINGLLCEYGKIESMYERVSDTFKNKQKMNELNKAAIMNAKQYKIENTANEWIKRIDKMPLKTIKYDTEKIQDNILGVLSFAADFETKCAKQKWLNNFYNKEEGNLVVLRKREIRNVVIFGTMHMSYFIYIDLLKENYNVVGFIDNNKVLPASINHIPIYDETWLEKETSSYDSVIVSIESSSSKIVKQRLKENFPGKYIFEWKELR
ncbi:glycosyltransferase family 4 protein [Psychrobacillus sp.]|uniref:glycosyltransferase family 4 protein n=1 Tax=Psychrobacillus sp. TaxID=1871623 RepID=UPI0028BD270D|nr:glycosyltransferase family 4 protein [Psychrobacillus sp.]